MVVSENDSRPLCLWAAPPSVAGVTFVGWKEPIGCGGVAVFPDDIVMADADGAVVIPAALPGLYPPNAQTRARYEAEMGKGGRPDAALDNTR